MGTIVGADQVTRILRDFLAPLEARLTVIEESFDRSTRSFSPEGPAVAQSEPAVMQPDVFIPGVSSADREEWLQIVEMYLKFGAPEFSGSFDPLVADKWKEDVGVILSLMGVDGVQQQRLAAFSLKGDANQWYKHCFSEEERSTVAWDEFIRRFDQQFISSTARPGKEAELLALEQGDLSVAAYTDRFVSLCNFTGNIFQTEERKVRMFQRGLRPQIRSFLASQSFCTLREVADAAIMQELECSATKDKEYAKAAGQNQRKGKRPFGAFEQQAPQQRRPVALRFSGSCHNCGRRGHKSFMCRLPQRGPDSPGSYSRPPQQAQARRHYSDFIPGSPPQQAQAQ